MLLSLLSLTLSCTGEEALAAWNVAELSLSLGLRKIVIERDALEVVQALRKEGTWRGSYGQAVQDANHRLSSLQE
jgi:peptidyl-tRNA hydrolase